MNDGKRAAWSFRAPVLALAVAAANAVLVVQAQAQDAEISAPDLEMEEPVMEEVVVIGRLIDSAQALVEERLDDEVVSDVLGAEQISRLGDSTVAAALRRVAGLTLVNDKFVYVRGLGERYSSASLNGAAIPSPDLTRNVIPLDIFPTSIVQSLQVQKGYSADRPASFGGGAVDIRTKSIPDGFTYSFEVGSGYNFENDGDVFTYNGGGDDEFGRDDGTRSLSPTLRDNLQRFEGDLDPQTILRGLRGEQNPAATAALADQINRNLALALNRDISIREKSDTPDYSFRGSIGSSWLLGSDWEAGFLVGGAYQQNWRENTRVNRNLAFPEERTDTELESTRNVQLNGVLNLGLRFAEEHDIAASSMYLRNTDDETAIRDFFNENRERSDGLGFREYRLDFEERDMVVNQIRGSHKIGEVTEEALPNWLSPLVSWIPDEFEFDWFVSDARATTNIPNQVFIDAQTVTDPITAEVISSQVTLDATAADFRFTKLHDDVENWGWNGRLPLFLDSGFLELSGGYNYMRKWRSYEQTQFGLGFTRVPTASILAGPLGDVFSDINILDTANDLGFDRQGTNNQSYLAAQTIDAAYGKIDYTLNDTWRFSAGLRWEDYTQVAIDWNPYGFSIDSPQIPTDIDALENATFKRDDIFPSIALTYMTSWWAETFQFRVGWSETVVRPDLREITDASYIDPITDDLVDGNPGVLPADVSNYDIRAEWFFTGGDNLTISAFYKDIDNPIEFFESAASDTNTAREIVNAESAEVYGIEIEGLKELAFLGGAFSNFFVQANITLQESELVAGPEADAPTNEVRDLAGASEWVVNTLLGYDSGNGRHTGTLAYNVSGERLYVAGRNEAPDGFEQPFHSLDLTWSWYPTETLTLKAKFQNILDDSIEIERRSGDDKVTVFREKPGSTFSLSLQWQY